MFSKEIFFLGLAAAATTSAHAIVIPPTVYAVEYAHSTDANEKITTSSYEGLQTSSTPSFELNRTQSSASFVVTNYQYSNIYFDKGIIRFTITDPASENWDSYNFRFAPSSYFCSYNQCSKDRVESDLGKLSEGKYGGGPAPLFNNVVLKASSNQFDRITSEGGKGIWTYQFESRRHGVSQPLNFEFEIFSNQSTTPFLSIVQTAVTTVPETSTALMALASLLVATCAARRRNARNLRYVAPAG